MISLRLRSLSLRTSLRLSAALGVAAVVGGLSLARSTTDPGRGQGHGTRAGDRAADILGVDRRTLYRMAERFGLDLNEIERGGEPPPD